MSDAWRGKAKDVQMLAQEEGVLVLQAGPDVVRLAPSLIIDEADMAEGMARLRAALRRLPRAWRFLPPRAGFLAFFAFLAFKKENLFTMLIGLSLSLKVSSISGLNIS